MATTTDVAALLFRGRAKRMNDLEIAALRDRITTLASKGKQVVAERDRLEAELSMMNSERDALRQRISSLVAKGRRVVADRDRWEAEAIRLSIELTQAQNKLQADVAAAEESSAAKFVAAKRAFARLFHPNNGSGDGFEKMVKTELFKSFWPVLESIEHGQADELPLVFLRNRRGES